MGRATEESGTKKVERRRAGRWRTELAARATEEEGAAASSKAAWRREGEC